MSKATFKLKTFASKTFASGNWAGVGVEIEPPPEKLCFTSESLKVPSFSAEALSIPSFSTETFEVCE